jgi:hypothetical protein
MSEPANPRLYANVISAAKRKFDVYPSAYANGWAVQEYKRRGGTYKSGGGGSGLDRSIKRVTREASRKAGSKLKGMRESRSEE